MRSYVHVLNPVDFAAEHPLTRAQAVTWEAMRVAREQAPGVEVEMMGACYDEDRGAVPPHFDHTARLSRSILDVKAFEKKRKLPFLKDILIRAFEGSEAETCIFTNIDIAPMPYFYAAVDAMVASGRPCFTVNRRTIPATPDTPDRLAEMYAQSGKPHPGHDCFVFPRRWIAELDLGEIITGVPWIGFILLANLACLGKDIQVHEDLHLTFHLGDDQAWTNPADLPYREHNAREALAVLQRLEKRYGIFPRQTYLGQHLTLAEQQVAAFDKARASGAYGGPRPLLAAVPGAAVPGPRRAARHRYVFSINSGRSGSEYLAQLLGTAEGAIAHHEAEPTMSGPWLRMVGGRGFAETLDLRMTKAEAITRALVGAPPGAVYVETNHMFIKTFWDVALKAFDPEDIDVIILRRHLPSVLKSFINLGYFSARNRVWPDWMHTLDARGSVLTPLGPQQALDQFDLAIGYLMDIEARALRFVSARPGCRIHEARLEGIQTPDAVSRLFSDLGLEATGATAGAVGRRVNDRGERKAQIGLDTSLEYCEHRIQVFTDLCARRGIELPPLPQLMAA